jgi:hypothetical protein
MDRNGCQTHIGAIGLRPGLAAAISGRATPPKGRAITDIQAAVRMRPFSYAGQNFQQIRHPETATCVRSLPGSAHGMAVIRVRLDVGLNPRRAIVSPTAWQRRVAEWQV